MKKPRTNFEFTVKAHQEISHKSRLRAVETSFQAFEHMNQICKTLNSKILLIQTPASFKPDKLSDAQTLFGKVNRENLILVWETRGPAWETKDASKKLGEALEKMDVTHVTGPLDRSRLKELVKQYEMAEKDVYILFNNLSMFENESLHEIRMKR